MNQICEDNNKVCNVGTSKSDGAESHITNKCLASKYSEINNVLITNHKNTPEKMTEKEMCCCDRYNIKINNVKQYNFRRHERQYSECSSMEPDPIMKCTVQNKDRKQQKIRTKTLLSAPKTCIQEKDTKEHQIRCKNLGNIASCKMQQKETKPCHA